MENEEPSKPPPVNPEPAEPNPAALTAGFLDRAGVMFSKSPEVALTGAGAMQPQDEKLWALFSHIGGILCLGLGMGFLPPLVIYLMQKDKSPFIACHAREALNFQLSYLIMGFACIFLSFLILPFFILLAGGVLMLVSGIMAGIRAHEGGFMALPFTIRMIK